MSNNLILKKVIPHFILALFLSFLGMLFGIIFLPVSLGNLASIVSLLMLVFVFIWRLISKKKREEDSQSFYGMRIPMWFTYLFVFLDGIGLYPFISLYVSEIGADWVLIGLFLTVLLFSGLSIYTYISKKDFSSIGGVLFIGLFALILVSLCQFFIVSSLLEIILAWVGIVLFSGYVLYDISRMNTPYFKEEDVPIAVLDLYLDFINLFIDIIRILSKFR